MKVARFNEIVEQVTTEIQERLHLKGEEYTPGGEHGDRFWNFKEAARINNWSVLQAWRGMWVKHDISIRDFLNSGLTPPADVVWEKVLDDICYKILLIGIWDEKRRESSTPDPSGE